MIRFPDNPELVSVSDTTGDITAFLRKLLQMKHGPFVDQFKNHTGFDSQRTAGVPIGFPEGQSFFGVDVELDTLVMPPGAENFGYMFCLVLEDPDSESQTGYNMIERKYLKGEPLRVEGRIGYGDDAPIFSKQMFVAGYYEVTHEKYRIAPPSSGIGVNDFQNPEEEIPQPAEIKYPPLYLVQLVDFRFWWQQQVYYIYTDWESWQELIERVVSAVDDPPQVVSDYVDVESIGGDPFEIDERFLYPDRTELVRANFRAGPYLAAILNSCGCVVVFDIYSDKWSIWPYQNKIWGTTNGVYHLGIGHAQAGSDRKLASSEKLEGVWVRFQRRLNDTLPDCPDTDFLWGLVDLQVFAKYDSSGQIVHTGGVETHFRHIETTCAWNDDGSYSADNWDEMRALTAAILEFLNHVRMYLSSYDAYFAFGDDEDRQFYIHGFELRSYTGDRDESEYEKTTMSFMGLPKSSVISLGVSIYSMPMHNLCQRHTNNEFCVEAGFKKIVLFSLDAALTTGTATQDATIIAQYGSGQENPDTAITVRNPRIHTASTYRWEGDSGDYGIAYHVDGQEYIILDMECP